MILKLAAPLISLVLAVSVCADDIYDAWGPEIITGLVAGGIEAPEAERTFAKVSTLAPLATGPGSWVYELAVPGQVHLRRAQELELDGELETALIEYERAMSYFDAARFPASYTPERKAAYKKQLDVYRKIAALTKFPLEIIQIPFEGKMIRVHFHKHGPGPHPALIWSGGLDGWKTSGMEFKQRLMSQGFSVLAIDLPGTGESEWPLEPNSDRIYSAVIAYLKTREDVDPAKIAVYFGSFSGVYAIKLALVNPDVVAAVNHSGGIHLFFNPPVDQLPPLTTTMGMRAMATTYAMGLFDQDIATIKSRLSEFSLMTQGLLKPTPSQASLLSIYGTADRLMPIQDLDVLIESGVKLTNLIYEGDAHMAWEHADDHQTKMIDWIKLQLKMQ